MNHVHELRPDLFDCLLEDRALPASFLESTFFLPPPITELGYNNDSLLPTSTASYNGFGSTPFGLGLSPLEGVVSAYSQNTALSNAIGAGSSEPEASETSLDFSYLRAAATSAVGAAGAQNQIQNPSQNQTQIQNGNGNGNGGPGIGPNVVRNYGSAFSSGFSFGINSTNNYGMGPRTVGSLIAAGVGNRGGSPENRKPIPPPIPPEGGPGAHLPFMPGPGPWAPGGTTPPLSPDGGFRLAPGTGARGGGTPVIPGRPNVDRSEQAPPDHPNDQRPSNPPRAGTDSPPGGWSVPQTPQPQPRSSPGSDGGR